MRATSREAAASWVSSSHCSQAWNRTRSASASAAAATAESSGWWYAAGQVRHCGPCRSARTDQVAKRRSDAG